MNWDGGRSHPRIRPRQECHMEEKPSHLEEGQAERARRLREKIDSLKTGVPARKPDEPKSIKEQIAERVNEIEKKKQE